MSAKKDNNAPVGVVECDGDEFFKLVDCVRELEQIRNQLENLLHYNLSDSGKIYSLQMEIPDLIAIINKIIDDASKKLNTDLFNDDSSKKTNEMSTQPSQSISEIKQKISRRLIDIHKEHGDNPISKGDLAVKP